MIDDDLLIGGIATRELKGDAGNDRLIGSDYGETLEGGPGADVL